MRKSRATCASWKLEKKDEQANFNLERPSAFLNVFDPDKVAPKVADFMLPSLSALSRSSHDGRNGGFGY